MANDICEKILFEALRDKIKLQSLISWLNDINYEAPFCGLVEEKEVLSQYKFVVWFLNYMRLKASIIINDKRPKNVVNSSAVSNCKSQKAEYNKTLPLNENDTKLLRPKDDYLMEFPSLQGSPLDNCIISHKRIKPTSVRNEDSCFNEKQLLKNDYASQSSSLSCSLNVRNEELLSQRFFGKKDKVQKPCFSPFQVEISYKDRRDFTPVNCSDTKLKTLNKLIDLYNSILLNYLVPNITAEIKFVLNIFNSVTENVFSVASSENQCENNSDEISILNSENEWRYFCTKIIITQEYLISNLECNILKFLVNRMSLFIVEIPASYSKINKDIMTIQSACAFHNKLFKILRLSANDFTDKDDFVHCCNLRKRFLETEKKWCTNRSQESLIEDIKFIVNICKITTHFYFLGQLLVFSLVKTIEDSISNGSNSKQKMAQLNTRLRTPFQHSDLELDNTFQSNELFFKLWLDYCLQNCPMVIHYVEYWIIYTILALKNDVHNDLGHSVYSNGRSKLLWTLKITITLAKFLGFIQFYFYRHNYNLFHDEKQQHFCVLSEILPKFDLKRCLVEAIKDGILVLTIPWIVEFFCMADNLSTYIPYYQDTFLALMSFYLSSHVRYDKDGQKAANLKKDLLKSTMLIPHTSFNDSRVERLSIILHKSSLVFLKLWIGKLFDSKVFGESFFLEIAHMYKEKISQAKFKSGHLNWRSAIDCSEFVKRDVFILCCSHFSKMKYWENSSRSYIKNIRPIPLDSELNTASLIDIQDQLEATFLTDNQSLESLINFIVERLSNICQCQISKIIAAETNDLHVVADEVEEGKVQCSVVSDQLHLEKKNLSNTENLLSVVSEILEVINSCENKIKDSLICLSPPDIPAAVLQVCNKIAFKKLKRITKDWLINEGFSSDEIEKCLMATNDMIQEDVDRTKEDTECISPSITSVSSSFISLHIFMREINAEKHTFQNFNFIIDKFWQISKQLHEMNEPKILKDLYVVSWDCVFLIVTHHHEILSSSFFSEIVNFWKENHYGDNEKRILCPRIVKAISFSNEESQRTSAINLATLMIFNLEHKIITPSCVETQSLVVLNRVWSKKELQFIKVFLTTLCNFLKSGSVFSTPILLSAIELTMDAVNRRLES